MVRRRFFAILCTFGLTHAASAQPQGALVPAAPELDALEVAPGLQLRPEGLGPVRAGMSVAQAERALHLSLRADPPALADDGDGEALAEWRSCHYESSPELPGVLFMVSADRVVRVDVEAGAWGTTRGVRLGTPEVEVLRRYPGIAVHPHPYVDFGHYLVLEATDDGGHPAAMIFETDGQVVTSFRSGAAEPVGYVEGCS